MTVRQWIRISPGVALYREGLTWLVDARVEKRRIVMSTKTRDLPEAVHFVEQRMWVDNTRMIQFRAKKKIAILTQQLEDATAKRPALPETEIDRIALRVCEIQGQPHRIITIKEAVAFSKALEGHLANIRAGTSTSEKYQNQIPGWINRFAEQAKVKTVGEVTRTHLNNHVAWLRTPSAEGGAGLGEKTVYNVKGGLKEFFTYCASEKWIIENPTEQLKLGAIPRPAIRFFLASEIDTVFTVGKKEYGIDTVAAFATACFAGPRLEEIYSLERDRIHLERRNLQIWDNKRKKWKTSPIFDCLVGHLESLLSASRGPRPFAARSYNALGASLSRLVKRALPRKELIQHDAGGERVDAALTCRRTFSTHLRALGVSATKVAKWSGHLPTVDSTTYCGDLPDGERAYPILFLGRKLISEGLPCDYPEPSPFKKVK